jgi:hypothetical protein
MGLEYFGLRIADLEIIRRDLGSLPYVLCTLPSDFYHLMPSRRFSVSPSLRVAPLCLVPSS